MDLENLISKKICQYLLKGNTEQNEEIILYGVQLIVETVFKFCLLLLLALIIKQGLACVIYIILLSGLRANAGGYHAKTNLGCTLTLFISFGIGVLLNQLEIPLAVSLGVCLIATAVCIKYAPMSTTNNPITDCRIIKTKKIKSVIVLCLFVVVIIYSNYDGYILSIIISVVASILILKYQMKIKVEKGE